ncbi:MAG: YbjN domain-containing protein [Actinomycetota bacterium]|nr:YbjN domain-containing protein [Actinomycetota bacterium]
MHGRDTSGPLAAIRRERRQFGELILSAVALAVGANLVSEWLSGTVGHAPALAIGLTLCVLILSVVLFTRPRRRDETLEGYVVVAEARGRPVPVPRYEMAEDVARQLQHFIDTAPEVGERWRESREAVIGEAVEAFALTLLSRQSDESFRRSVTDPRIQTMGRDELSEVLASNHILNLLTDPELLPPIDTGAVEGEVVALIVPGGATAYEQLRIRLPRGSTLRRRDGELRVRTRACEVRITAACDDLTVLPDRFARHYLGLRDETLQLTARRVTVTASVRFPPSAFLRARALEYSEWVDAYLRRLGETVSSAAFEQTINWPVALTVIDSLRGMGGEQEMNRLALGPVGSAEEAAGRASEIMQAERIPFESYEGGRLLRVRRGSATVFVEVAQRPDGVVLHLSAPVLQQVEVDGVEGTLALLQEVNAFNASQSFGRFIHHMDSATISLDYELLADEMHPTPLVHALDTIARTADEADDVLQRALGTGRRTDEVATTARLGEHGAIVLEATELSELDRALSRAARDERGGIVTTVVEAGDGEPAEVALDRDGQILQVVTDMGQYHEGGGTETLAFMKALGGLVAVALDEHSRPVHGPQYVDELSREA